MPNKEKLRLKPSPHTPPLLRNILNNDVIRAALDYSQAIDPYINKVIQRWQANLEKRVPAPIYTEGPDGYPLYRGTDYDIFTLSLGLAARDAIINIPEYLRRTPPLIRSDEWRLTESPHGQVLGIISNKEAHSFSMRIKDFGVARKKRDGSEELGRPRNIMIVDYFGKLYPGLSEIQFITTEEQRDFLKRYGIPYEESERLFKGKPFVCKQFVFPQLWRAFYTLDYLIAKALTQRCEYEGKLYRQRVKYLEENLGIKLPVYEVRLIEYERPLVETEKVKVKNLEAKLDLGAEKPNAKILPIISMDRNGNKKLLTKLPSPKYKEELQGILRYSKRRTNDMSWGIGSRIRTISRAVEYAMFLYGFRERYKPGEELRPKWSDEWQPIERGWQVLPISDQVTLMYRIAEHTITQKKLELEYPAEIVLEGMMM